jgi:hypothetical protein
MKVSYLVRVVHKWGRSILFQCIVSILCVMLILWCGCMKYSILYKGGGLRLIIYACYSWEMALNFGLDVSSDNIQDRKWIQQKAKAYVTNDNTSFWILTGFSSNTIYNDSQNALERSSATIIKLINVESSAVRNPNMVCTNWGGFIIHQILLTRADQIRERFN